MTLYWYFLPLDTLPHPSGPPSTRISSAAIKDINEAVRNASQGSSKPRGKYAKFTPEQKASDGKYASLHSNQAAIHHFSCSWELKWSLFWFRLRKGSIWPKSATSRKLVRRAILVSSPCPSRRVGDICYLVKNWTLQVKHFILVVCEGGRVINAAITMATAIAIVRKAENGGPITVTSNWAKSILYRMNFVERRGSSYAKITVANFEVVKEQFVLDVNAVVEMEDIPPDLVLNWDQTGISIVKRITFVLQVYLWSGTIANWYDWYSMHVQHQLDEEENSPVDLRMSTIKPLGARCLVTLYD